MNKQKYLQIARFLVGGGVGVIAYYIAFYTLTELGLWYVASSVVAFLINSGVNFVIQKYWTFQNTNTGAVRRQLVWYVGSGIGLLISNMGLLYLLVEHAQLHYLLAQGIVTIFLTVVSYAIMVKIFAN